MSNELDIDLELEEMDETDKKKGKKKGRILAAVAVVIILAVCIVFAFYIDSGKYLVTDNAKVTSDIYSVTAKADGKLVKFDAYVGKNVESGDIVGRVDGGPYIKAPADGEFVKVDAKRGEYVCASDVIGIVANTDHMYIGANIEEGDITKIKEGQKVKVSLDAYGSKAFDGVVTKVNNITSNALSGSATSFSTSGTYTKTTQLIPIEISLSDPELPLERIIGTNATVKIKIKD